MKTGQMLFVAFGGMLLGAAGTLAVQTGLVHYEISLDIRPRGAVTLPPPALSTTNDPYSGPLVQSWEPVPTPTERLPVAMPPLDDQQIAEIVSVREQIGSPVAQKLGDLNGSTAVYGSGPSFADHLRAAAGATQASPPPEDVNCPAGDLPTPIDPEVESSVARGLREAQLK